MDGKSIGKQLVFLLFAMISIFAFESSLAWSQDADEEPTPQEFKSTVSEGNGVCTGSQEPVHAELFINRSPTIKVYKSKDENVFVFNFEWKVAGHGPSIKSISGKFQIQATYRRPGEDETTEMFPGEIVAMKLANGDTKTGRAAFGLPQDVRIVTSANRLISPRIKVVQVECLEFTVP
jgi:hypothetical protein